MKIDIKVISTEIITPSSPTPKDLSNYKLSFIDQNIFPIFIHWTLFYKANVGQRNSELSIRLKKSLSQTLTLYYPLAGRVVDNTNVDCNDQGIVYVEARADCMLEDAINESINPIELDKLNPKNPGEDVYPYVCLIVQTTFFNCGGLAIGVAFNHKVCDGWSFSLFAKNWAAISRGDNHIQSPIFNGAKLFPPISNIPKYDPEIIYKEDIITKRFIFTASKINDLRDKYTTTTRATKIEALTAFIFSRFIASQTGRLKKISGMFHVVNFRKRVIPPLRDESFGNFIQQTAVVSLSAHGDDYGIVHKLKDSIQSVGGSEYVNFVNSNKVNPFSVGDGEVVPFMFSSFCRFPLYESDFGWGKPAWIGIGTSDMKNLVRFTDSPIDEGSIEAWVSLKLEDMAKLEADEEVVAFAKTK